MKFSKSLLHYSWRVVLCAFTFAFGLVVSRLIFHSFGLTPPRLPQQADESTAVYYLLSGSLILSLGLFPLVIRIVGNFLKRFIVVFIFVFAGFAVSVSLESSIYSSATGFNSMIAILFLPILFFSLLSTSLTSSSPKYDTVSPGKALL